MTTASMSFSSLRRALLLSAAMVTAALGCGAEPPPAAPLPKVKPPPPPVTAEALKEVPVSLDQQALRVVYRDAWFGAANLVGVSASPHRALVRLDAQSPPRIVFDLIDIPTGQRVDRFELPPESARWMAKGESPFGANPTSGSPGDTELTSSLTRLADLVTPLGPWHTRAGIPWPTFAASRDRSVILFGARSGDGGTGDWLMGRSGPNAGVKRIDEGFKASYAPVLSPSNELVAFRGCNISPCDYGLFVMRLGAKPARVSGIRQAAPPVYDRSGASLFLVGEPMGERPGKRCLFKVNASTLRVETLHCVTDLRDVTFVQDDDGRTGVMAGTRGAAGKQDVVFTWILLESGAVLGTHTVERASGHGALSNSGLLMLPMQRGGAKLVDLVGDRSATLTERIGWFMGFEASRWVNDEITLVRKPEGSTGFEVVLIRGRVILP